MPSPPHDRRQQRSVLEELLGAPERPPSAPAMAPPKVPAATVPAPPEAPSEAAIERFTTSLPATLVERARTAVYHTPGLTLSGLAAEALTREIDRLEQLRGQSLPAGRGPLRTGRPVR